jgi:hypothetical protein
VYYLSRPIQEFVILDFVGRVQCLYKQSPSLGKVTFRRRAYTLQVSKTGIVFIFGKLFLSSKVLDRLLEVAKKIVLQLSGIRITYHNIHIQNIQGGLQFKTTGLVLLGIIRQSLSWFRQEPRVFVRLEANGFEGYDIGKKTLPEKLGKTFVSVKIEDKKNVLTVFFSGKATFVSHNSDEFYILKAYIDKIHSLCLAPSKNYSTSLHNV